MILDLIAASVLGKGRLLQGVNRFSREYFELIPLTHCAPTFGQNARDRPLYSDMYSEL
jgi:hypothetical protein